VLIRIGIAAAVLALALAVAWVLRRRRPEAPPRAPYPVPRQLDRSDFPRSGAPWLVAYFSSDACSSCRGLGPKVTALDSSAVVACELSFEARRDLHDRYDVAAIPMVLVADHEGVVRRAFVGATSATDLWAALAELRDPGVTPEPGLGALG
jgi:hypothetical protein